MQVLQAQRKERKLYTQKWRAKEMANIWYKYKRLLKTILNYPLKYKRLFT